MLTPLPSVAVRYFLKNKVSPDLCNEDGLTALHQVRLGSPPGHVPHLPAFPARNPQGGGREGREAAAAPSERISSASGMCVSVTNTSQSHCAHTCDTHTVSVDREPLSTASSRPSKGFDKQSEFVWGLTVSEAHSFTPTKASVYLGDKGD